MIVSFPSFDLEDSANCEKDYVQIDTVAAFLGLEGFSSEKYCGSDIVCKNCEGNQISVRLVSDDNIEKTGFTARYSKKWGGELTVRNYKFIMSTSIILIYSL